MSYQDILYEVRDQVAWITINRPERRNAFRPETVDELIDAFRKAWADRGVGVAVLSGAQGTFCSGGDQKARGATGYGDRPGIGLDVAGLHGVIRSIPKPVVAMVDGYAIGGGHVLHVVCDLTIASDRAIFGQVGPRMGSVDPGFGTAYLARVVGEKKAREIWYLCRRYSGAEAVAMGLANICVAPEQLDAEVQLWGEQLCQRSPTAIAIAKRSFNMDTAHQAGIAGMGMMALKLYYDTDESREGVAALKEKRKPEFRKFAK